MINIGSELNFQECPLLNSFLTEASQQLKIQQFKVIKGNKPEGILHQEGFGNDECVNFVRLGNADVIFVHDRGFDSVQYTYYPELFTAV